MYLLSQLQTLYFTQSTTVTRGGAHFQYIYIIDSKRYQVDQLKTLGQVHYTKPLTILRTTAGRMDERMDGHHLKLRTFNYTKSRFFLIFIHL